MAGLRAAFDDALIPILIIGEPPVFDLLFTDQPVTSYRDTLSNNKPLVARFNQQLLNGGVFCPDSKFYVSIGRGGGHHGRCLCRGGLGANQLWSDLKYLDRG